MLCRNLDQTGICNSTKRHKKCSTEPATYDDDSKEVGNNSNNNSNSEITQKMKENNEEKEEGFKRKMPISSSELHDDYTTSSAKNISNVNMVNTENCSRSRNGFNEGTPLHHHVHYHHDHHKRWQNKSDARTGKKSKWQRRTTSEPDIQLGKPKRNTTEEFQQVKNQHVTRFSTGKTYK